MRYIKDIINKEFKIGVYQWNNKYIVKIEAGLFEQTYKIEEYEVQDLAELETCIDEVFLATVKAKFISMEEDFFGSLKRHNVLF